MEDVTAMIDKLIMTSVNLRNRSELIAAAKNRSVAHIESRSQAVTYGYLACQPDNTEDHRWNECATKLELCIVSP